jgi:hypothetical protein
LTAAERALKLDPLSDQCADSRWNCPTATVGATIVRITELRRALELLPGHTNAQFNLGVTFVAMGRMDDAIRELELAARPSAVHNSRME